MILQYISKYVSKAKTKSAAFTEIFDQILNNSNLNENLLSLIQKLLINSISKRDISAQKTCHLLLDILLYHSSWSYISLNLNMKTLRRLQDIESSENDTEHININKTGHTMKSALKNYWKWPIEFEKYSLFKLYLTYKFIKGCWKRCEKDNIVQILSHSSALCNRD